MSYLKVHDEHTDRGGGWSASVVYIESALGGVQAEVCEACGCVTTVLCEHKYATWYDEAGAPVEARSMTGVVLLCNLCGIDGT